MIRERFLKNPQVVHLLSGSFSFYKQSRSIKVCPFFIARSFKSKETYIQVRDHDQHKRRYIGNIKQVSPNHRNDRATDNRHDQYRGTFFRISAQAIDAPRIYARKKDGIEQSDRSEYKID